VTYMEILATTIRKGDCVLLVQDVNGNWCGKVRLITNVEKLPNGSIFANHRTGGVYVFARR